MLKGKANREVCNVKILDYATNQPIIDFEYANTTGLDITSDNVYAMAHGSRKIAFNNPLDGELTIEAQVLPNKMYALYSDGVIDTTASYYVKKTVTCETAGEIPVASTGATVITGTVFVYKEGEFGETPIAGTFATNKFTATQTADIASGSKYEVGYMVSRESGVQKIVFNNKRIPKDVSICMDTLYKDEDGNMIPVRINVFKCNIVRNMSLTFSSEGDPQSVEMRFTMLEKDRDNFFEMIELSDDIED